MSGQDSVSIREKNTLIQNCFFLWSHALILLLTAIPVVSQIISLLLNIPVWTVPKVYELKMYAIAMVICVAMPFISRYAPEFFLKNHSRYQLFMLFFYPGAVFIYSISLPDFARYMSVFVFALIGLVIYIRDIYSKKILKNLYFNYSYNTFLLISVSFSIFLIICKSDSNNFNLFSILAFTVFISIFLILRFINIQNKFLVYLVPIFIFIVTYGSMQEAMEVTHYSFFLGPVIEVLYGHFHPLSLEIQYGGGLTTFLALYFKSIGLVSFVGMQDLLKLLTFIQYLLIYYIAISLYRSQKIAFLTLLAILLFNFFAPNIKYYYCAPSINFLRFGLIYLILLCYTLQDRLLSSAAVIFITSILSSIAVLWSFESAVYTLPAILFAEYIDKNLRKFLPVFIGCFSVITLAYLSPFLLQGKWPPVWRYYEYAMVYANGFGQIPLNRLTSFWWLFPLLYGFLLIKIISGDISNKTISALTIYGIAIFTYFAGRSHPIGVFVISIPFILLSFYLIINLKISSLLIKQMLLSAGLVIFASAYYVLDSEHVIIQGVWKVNLPLVKNFIFYKANPPFFISDSGSSWLNKEFDYKLETNCSIYSPLKKYIENNSIAILSTDDKNLLGFYACTKSHNALTLNPYYETALNPKAVARIIKKVNTVTNHYILIESNLQKSKFDLWGSEMTTNILRELHTKKVGELRLEGDVIDIYQFQSNNL